VALGDLNWVALSCSRKVTVEGSLFGASVLRYPKSKDPTWGEEKDHIDDLG
jgi:hypothetical protein